MTESNDGPDDEPAGHARELYDQLAATAELPVERETSRWLGEAEAVARDAATNDLERSVLEKRVRQVAHLLAEADEPTHDEAAAHLEAARELCATILEGDAAEE